MRTIDPTTGEVIRELAPMTHSDVSARLAASARAFAEWRAASFEQRARPVRAAAAALRERGADHAELMAREMGKPVREGRAEVEKCAWVCEYYADRAASMLAPQPVHTGASASYVSYQPLGPVLAIMPWNFPFWQVFRCAVPALMAGNTVVLKHASNVTGCAEAIEQLWAAAGLPSGAFTALIIPSSRVADVIGDDRIAAVSLTGSTEAGRAVASCAGGHLKKTVLELGGSDPYVVLADADIDAAAEVCVEARLINGGQSCIAAKRFVVVDDVRERFEDAVVSRFRDVAVGAPMDPSTELGPLARDDLRHRLHEQVARSLDAGARCALGGELPGGPGFFYPPTVLTGVARGMPAHDEELFGPVAAIEPARSEAEAIAIANATRYGLGAAVLTGDRALGERIARDHLRAGNCFVNTHVRSDPRLPFGGVGHSGYGRELGAEGIRELVNVKTVYVA